MNFYVYIYMYIMCVYALLMQNCLDTLFSVQVYSQFGRESSRW